ncbi:hypothetical protein J27TS7_57550 [Paenibacillus dendritiformis]|nr:hypothetical protein J27TS7_57550 [Paenibacillus dendritiformis]
MLGQDEDIRAQQLRLHTSEARNINAAQLEPELLQAAANMFRVHHCGSQCKHLGCTLMCDNDYQYRYIKVA